MAKKLLEVCPCRNINMYHMGTSVSNSTRTFRGDVQSRLNEALCRSRFGDEQPLHALIRCSLIANSWLVDGLSLNVKEAFILNMNVLSICQWLDTKWSSYNRRLTLGSLRWPTKKRTPKLHVNHPDSSHYGESPTPYALHPSCVHSSGSRNNCKKLKALLWFRGRRESSESRAWVREIVCSFIVFHKAPRSSRWRKAETQIDEFYFS